ncbi:MAG: hypothetical protein II557_03270, partial [Clostridia bacterium]|nr:hypothetical protein [Clostridia bacterium]
ISEEKDAPLLPIDLDLGGPLFRVSYYKKRINLELFHALADGTGAFVFFKSIVGHYLAEAHPDRFDRSMVETPDVSGREQESDGFTENFRRGVGSPLNFEFLGQKNGARQVYHFDERKSADLRQSVTEGWVSASKIHAAGKAVGATVTEYICAELILAIRETMAPADRKKSVAVAIPVNLRRYFESDTMRNFFGIIQVTYDFSAEGEHTIERVARSVKASFERELTQENMEQKIASQVKMERHPVVRFCPLVLKDFIMRTLQGVSMKRRTIALSNVGRISMNEPFAGAIERFDVFNSSSSRQICMCSFGDKMTLTFASVFAEHDVERAFFRRLAKVDPDIVVAANYLGE